MTRAIKWWFTALAVITLYLLHLSRPEMPASCTTDLWHWWAPQPDDPAIRQAVCR